MAAFFSAAGLDKTASDSVTETETVEVVGIEKSDLKESGKPSPVEPTSTPLVESEPVTKKSENDEAVVVAKSGEVTATASDNSDDSDNNSEKGETLMTTTEKPTAGGSSHPRETRFCRSV